MNKFVYHFHRTNKKKTLSIMKKKDKIKQKIGIISGS